MRLFVVGLSHRTAPVELRESRRLRARRARRRAARRWPTRGICQEAVVLSTCNRAEVYAVTRHRRRRRPPRPVLQRVPPARSPRDGARISTRCTGGDAARHLFRVAAGLDSLVVGEPQILGQVKAAYADGERPPVHRPAPQPAVPLVVRRRQAGAHGDRPRRRRRLGQLRGDRAGEEDLRQAVGARGAGPRRRRDGRAHARTICRRSRSRQMTIASRTLATAEAPGRSSSAAAAVAWDRDRRRRCAPPTSSSPRPARPSRC